MSRKPFATGRRIPKGAATGARGLLQYIARAHPDAFKRLAAERPELIHVGARLDGLDDAAAPASSVADKVSGVVTAIGNAVLPFLQLDAQRKLLNAQVQRAKQGLPPLDVSGVKLPPARLEVDTGATVSKYVRYAGIGLLLLGSWYVLRAGMRAQR